MEDQQDVIMLQNDQITPGTLEEGVMNVEKSTRIESKIDEYCKRALEKDKDNLVDFNIIDQSGVSEFRSHVNKMKMWPSFDHIFKAARRDNKWYLRSQPLKGLNKILFEEQKLISISKVRSFMFLLSISTSIIIIIIHIHIIGNI